MSFVKVGKKNAEYISLVLRPNVHVVSSSVGGDVLGSEYVSPIRSKCFKQVINLEASIENLVDDALDGDSNISQYNVDNFTRALFLDLTKEAAKQGISDIEPYLSGYISLIEEAPKDVRFDKKIEVFRFDPPFSFTKNTTVKNVVRNVLMPFYEHKYDNCGFQYTNYHTLNFFDNDDKIPTGSCLLYPNIANSYDLPDNFSINFWINPRYSSAERDYKAGTILHISSSICISLVSGSTVNVKGEEDTFKILLQLSHSADTPPSSIDLNNPVGAYPNDLIFTSSHLLTKNHWHNVFIAWSKFHQNSTGSLFIDDKLTRFHVGYDTLSSSVEVPALVLGNYYNNSFIELGKAVGDSYSSNEGFPPQSRGVGTVSFDDNVFTHPLNAEIHDIRIYNKYINKSFRKYKNLTTESPTTTSNMVFYVPPYFYPSSSDRQVLLTPFQTADATTNDPFNVSFSFGVGGKMINLENFVLDFVNMRQPRLLELTPTTIDTTIQNISADDYVYTSGSILKRNFTILPNDNGLHSPKYDLLQDSTHATSSMFTKRNKVLDHSIISLHNLVPTASLYPGLVFVTGSIFQDICGTAPDNPGVAPGSVLTIAQRTRDVSSNEIVVLDVSNLYYGKRIHPGSVTIYEENLTGSNGDISITIKDNGRGGLYRADSVTKHAEWNNVGNVLYEDGIFVIKTPHLLYFGKDKLDLKMKGEQSLHSMVLNVPCPKSLFMSSSNKTYKDYPPDESVNNSNLSSIYITTVNVHDDNFNVIMKANLSQPIIKTEEDEFIIRLKQDF